MAESIRFSGPDVRDNYPALRDAMRSLYESTHEYLAAMSYTVGLIENNDVVPMDVSAAQFGKGKKGGKDGKSKVKGKTKDEGKNGKNGNDKNDGHVVIGSMKGSGSSMRMKQRISKAAGTA